VRYSSDTTQTTKKDGAEAMRISKFVRMAAVVTAVTLAAVPQASADIDTDTMDVSASVTKNCTVTTSAVAFGSYDVNSSADLDEQGGVTVACTKGVTATISLSGSNAGRAMTGPGGAALSYALYQNSGRSTAWDGTSVATYASVTRASQNLTVYGRIPKNQDVTFGAYSDDVTATINF
jgi:spore coat protein U-like protein